MMFNHMVEKRQLAIEGSIRQDHGFLSHASRARSLAVGDLRRLSETQAMGRHSGWSHFHFTGRDRDDRSELALR